MPKHSVKSALMGAALIAAVPIGLVAQAGAATGAAAATTVAPTAPSAWVLGIAQFSPAEPGEQQSILLSALPRLIVAELMSLPARRIPADDASEAAKRNTLRARFAAGIDLAAKLDARDLGFLDPSLGKDARKAGIIVAEKNISESVRKLDEATREHSVAPSAQQPAADLETKLWGGHAAGRLIDPPTADLPKAAKAAAVDFLVTGSVAIESGYATVIVRGYDAALAREVFSWKSFCAIDDPEPLAKDISERLEQWTAGRKFARMEFKPNPATAEIYVNGELLPGSSRVAYIYVEGPVGVTATASGYSPFTTSIDLALGDKKTLELKLEPLATGSVSLSTDPSNSSISLDSVPLGRSPLSIGLNGSRAIISASAEGREPQTVVLPASGDLSMDLILLPADGLGPSGRISAAKDRFYSSLGWFVVFMPLTALSYGAYHGYDEAYLRSGSLSMYNSRSTATAAVAVAGTATATAAVFMVIRLVKYLKTAR